MPCSPIPRRKPRLVITVTTTVSFGEPAAVAAVDGGDGDDLVAVDEPAVGVDGEHPVGVAVEGEPDVGAALDHGLLQVLRVGRAAAGVDVGAVGLVVEDLHGRPERPQHLGRDRGGGTVGAVDHERQPLEAAAVDRARAPSRPSGSTASDPSTTVPTASPVRAAPARSWASSACSSASSAVSTSSVSLRPPAANSLMPLSSNGLCDAEITAPAAALGGREPRHRRRRHHAERRDLHPFGREPGDQRRLQQRPRQPGVPPHDELPAARAPAPRRDRARGPAPASARGWRRPRTPSVPNFSTGRACQSPPAGSPSASSTAEPCGPS